MTTTINVSRDEIRDAIREAIKESWQHGDGWVYARLYADGRISTGREVSQAIPESEYFRREGHPVTFFSRTASPGDRYTQWAEGIDDLTDEQIAEALDSDLSAEDFDEETDEAIRAIEEAGYTLEEDAE